MRMHIQAADPELWRIVSKGFTEVEDEKDVTDQLKKDRHLNNQASDILFNALTEDQFNRISKLNNAKEIWDTLCEIYEGTTSVKESRIDVLKSKVNRFIAHEGESVSEVYARLSVITNELQGLGAKEITEHEVVKMFLKSLEAKYDTLCTLIRERADFKELTPTQVLGRINAHEIVAQEKKELLALTSHTRRSTALKAKKTASSSEASSDSEEDEDSEASLGKELALLVKRFKCFNKYNKGNRSSKFDASRYSKDSPSDSKKRVCYKCGESGHFIANCPGKKKHDKEGRSDKKEKNHKSHSKKPKHYKKDKYKAKAYLGQEWDSDSDSESSSDSDSETGKEAGMAGLAFNSQKTSRSIFDLPSDDESPLCLMAKGPKVSSRASHSSMHNDSSSDDVVEAKPSYKTTSPLPQGTRGASGSSGRAAGRGDEEK